MRLCEGKLGHIDIKYRYKKIILLSWMPVTLEACLMCRDGVPVPHRSPSDPAATCHSAALTGFIMFARLTNKSTRRNDSVFGGARCEIIPTVTSNG